ncbi:UNVERIFIED_CONTAM: hypothetical protein K2H54_046663 [Gekko kuhli]
MPGFFGKGILSRSRPEYGISEPALVVKWQGARLNMPVISSKKFQRYVEWAKSRLKEQGLDDCTINKFLLNYIKPLNLEGKDEQTNESGNEETQAMEPAEPRLVVTSDERNQAARPERDLHCDPLGKCGSNELDRTGFQAVTKTHSAKNPSSLHDDSQQDDCVKQRSPVLSSGEYSHQEFVLVQEESDWNPEEENAHEASQLNKKEKLVCRRNPFRIFEYLQLSLEEAFFLVYGLGCLNIYYNEVPLSILKLWEFFSEVQPNFRTTYMAYHYFRGKGWVPKVGLKYGTDLLLYRKGPPFYHARLAYGNPSGQPSMLVGLPLAPGVTPHRVTSCCSGGAGCLRASPPGLSGLVQHVWVGRHSGRAQHPSQELMFCYLIKPSDMTEEEMSSPECLKRIKVQELILHRWVSSRERSELDEL